MDERPLLLRDSLFVERGDPYVNIRSDSASFANNHALPGNQLQDNTRLRSVQEIDTELVNVKRQRTHPA